MHRAPRSAHVPDVTFFDRDFWHMFEAAVPPSLWHHEVVAIPCRRLMQPPSRRSLLRIAGVVAWTFAGVPALHDACFDPPQLSLAAAWIGSFLLFGFSFWRSSGAVDGHKVSEKLLVLLALQTASFVGMLACTCSGFEAALLVIVGAQLGMFLPVRIGLPWLLVQSVAFWFVARPHWQSLRYFVGWALSVIGFGIFAYVIAIIAQREARARAEVARSNAELRATRELLEMTSRDAERLRIARELHDLLGHDLVALNLHLEQARHLSGEKAHKPLELAQRAAKQLLGDVREAVSSLRDEPSIDVAAALRTLLEGVTSPRIHLDMPDTVAIDDPWRAQAFLRCVQEIVTNAVKHASADNLWLTITPEDNGLVVRARDDGCGATVLHEGNGLTGMRERLQQLGGRMSFDSPPTGGFHLEVSIPLTEGTA